VIDSLYYSESPKKMNKNIIVITLSLILSTTAFQTFAQQDGNIESKVRQALNAPFRTDDERHADTYRLPAETLTFLGLKEDMRVMEIIPGDGYYSKILGQVLAGKGKLYLAADGERAEPELHKAGLHNVEILDDNFATERREGIRQYSIVGDFSFDVRDLDMVLTFRNTHNFQKHDNDRVYMEIFKTLKSGGIFGIVGHTRRHMEPYDEARWRRMDPVGLIKQLQDIGFKFKDYSNLHYRPTDRLVHDTTHPHVNRDSDRFTMIFVKP
jgi:predicted methyltransferase